MRRNIVTLSVVVAIALAAFTSQIAHASCSQTVTNTNNSGAGSLRTAISSAGNGGSVCFNISGSGIHIISITSTIASNQPVTIDGSTQPGYSGSPLIEVDGTNAGNANGIILNGGNSTLNGIAINNFQADGLDLQTNGGDTVTGSYFGTDGTGTIAKGNGGSGIGILSGNNTIGGDTANLRDVISGNKGNGIVISGSSATGNVVKGIYIGTNASGSAALGNGADGLLIVHAPNNTIGGTTGVTPGGACTGDCNLISGNGANGMGIWLSGATGNNVKGNFIGMNPAGTAALSNGDIGLEIQDTDSNTVGGTTPAERNILSGNLGAGISLTSSGAFNNTIEGNYIGPDTTGQTGIGNHKMGINIGSTDGSSNNAHNNIIGGTTGVTPGGSCNGACNVISANAWNGIYISGSTGGANQIIGNFIGASASGGLSMGNVLDGIGLLGTQSNIIGGSTAAERNIISNNGGNGVVVIGDTAGYNLIKGNYIGEATNQGAMPNHANGVSIAGGILTGVLGNSIEYNAYMGIDLGLNNAVTPNDAGDGDGGANGTQNFPVLSYAIPTGNNETIAGSINTLANTPMHFEFFASPACDSRGYGEGQNYLGSGDGTTASNGNLSFTFNNLTQIPGGWAITATASRVSSGNYETSEFSACIYTPRQHPDGTLIVPSGSHNIFLTENGQVRPIGSPEVLESYNMSPTEFKTATTADTNLSGGANLYFREGTLIKGSGPNVYVIDETSPGNYVKRKITSGQFFNSLGYTPSDVITVPDSALGAADGPDISDASLHPDGSLIENSSGTVYLIDSGQKRLVGSPTVFVSQRYKASWIKTATSGDLALTSGPNVDYREGAVVKGSGPNVYVIDATNSGIQKRRLASGAALTELGYKNSDIITIPDQELPSADGPGI
jgi:hypothetical protein